MNKVKCALMGSSTLFATSEQQCTMRNAPGLHRPGAQLIQDASEQTEHILAVE